MSLTVKKTMLTKQIAVIFGALAVCFTILFLILRPTPIFSYDFENFFAADDPELVFYNEFRTVFENDNDYLLISLGHEPDVFDREFLERAMDVEGSLKNLENVTDVQSILSAEEPLIGPFGVSRRKMIQWDNAESLTNIKKRIGDDAYIVGNLISADFKHLLIILRNEQMIDKSVGDRLYRQVEEVLHNSGLSDYQIAGKIKAQAEFVSLLQEEFSFFLVITFLLILVWLYLIFRSVWGVLLPVFILGIGFFWSVAFLLLTGGELDVLVVMQPPILLVIGLSGIVHLMSSYKTKLQEGLPKYTAIQETFRELAVPVFLTCLTTSVGFFSLTVTDVISLNRFGWYTGFGVLWMFLAIILIMPLSLYFLPPLNPRGKVAATGVWQRTLGFLFLSVLRRRRVVHFWFVVLSITAVIGVSQVKTNGYILDNLPLDHPLIQEFQFFDQTFGGSKPLEFHLSVGEDSESLLDYEVLKEIDRLEGFIQQTFQTGTILSPLTLVKSLNKAQNQGNPKAFRFPTVAQYDRMGPFLGKFLENQPIPLLTADRRQGRMSTYMADIGSLKGEVLEKQLDDFLANKIRKGAVQVEMTGTSYLIDRSHRQVTEHIASGLGTAFLCVAILTGLLFRSWRMALIGLIPNLIPLLLMGGVMFLFGVNLNLSTAIIFAVAFGIAVDDSIHFITKLGSERKKGKSLIYGLKRTYLTTGKALVLTTVILSSGFLVLTGSDFQITFYAGLLIGLSLIFALLADLLWLPILILPMSKVWDRNQ